MNMNWERVELKNKTKQIMTKQYWTGLVVILIVTILGGGFIDIGGVYERTYGEILMPTLTNTVLLNNIDLDTYRNVEEFDVKLKIPGINLIETIASGPQYEVTIASVKDENKYRKTIIASVILFILVGWPLKIGTKKFFLNWTKEKSNLNDLFFVFKEKKVFKIIKTLLYKEVKLLLWTLCFLIPGIIKTYAYTFVPYIVAENPDLSSREVIKISEKLTSGEKWKIFELYVSFIGWNLLGMLAFGIGILGIQPYVEGTFAELYKTLKLEKFGEEGFSNLEKALI